MDKEKKIQEMADIVEIYCSNHFDEEVCENPYKSDCDKCIYCALVEAGYRKADAVRKEILEEVGNIYICLDEDNEEMYARDLSWYKKLCDKYGVEVKE